MRKKKRTENALTAGVRYRLHDLLDVPLESLAAIGVVEIYGGCEAAITGARCVLKYDADVVVVETVDGVVRIEGSNLEMGSFVQDRITVKGKIRAVYPGKVRKEDVPC